MNLPLTLSDRQSVSDLRAEIRTHLFLTAVLRAGPTQTPVHIRNLSASGALIEGSALPAAGAMVSVCRGDLSVGGIIAWRSHKQAGIAFKSNISVATWLPGNRGSRQCAIDKVVFRSKNAPVAQAAPSTPSCAPPRCAPVLAELAALKKDILSLGELLVQDVILVATHPEIQLLDVVIQRVRRLELLAAEPAAARDMGTTGRSR